MPTVLLIRHGETDWNAAGRFQGRTDIALNERGRAQARALAERLADESIDRLVASDLRRAAETAEIVGAALGIVPHLDPRWRERDGGPVEGLGHEETVARFGERAGDLRFGHIALDGAETNHDLWERVRPAYEELVADADGKTIAVVAHGGTLRTLLAGVLGVPIERCASFHLRGNTGLTRVEYGPRGPRLTQLNCTTHLTRPATG